MSRSRAIDTRLERLLPASEEWFVTGVFTREELRDVVKKRTSFEYRLAARPLLLLDVQDAIKYELGLEARIAAFLQSAHVTLRHRGAVLDRIEGVYYAAFKGLRRRPSDKKVVEEEYIAFCRTFNRIQQLSMFFAQRIQQHPTEHQYWIEGATWEMDHLKADNARAIIQSAIRLLPASVPIWAHALEIELVFVERLITNVHRDAAKETERAKKSKQPLPSRDRAAFIRSESEALGSLLLDLELCKVVASSAIDSAARSVQLLGALVDTTLKFPFSLELLEHILSTGTPAVIQHSMDPTDVARACGMFAARGFNESAKGLASCSEVVNRGCLRSSSLPAAPLSAPNSASPVAVESNVTQPLPLDSLGAARQALKVLAHLARRTDATDHRMNLALREEAVRFLQRADVESVVSFEERQSFLVHNVLSRQNDKQKTASGASEATDPLVGADVAFLLKAMATVAHSPPARGIAGVKPAAGKATATIEKALLAAAAKLLRPSEVLASLGGDGDGGEARQGPQLGVAESLVLLDKVQQEGGEGDAAAVVVRRVAVPLLLFNRTAKGSWTDPRLWRAVVALHHNATATSGGAQDSGANGTSADWVRLLTTVDPAGAQSHKTAGPGALRKRPARREEGSSSGQSDSDGEGAQRSVGEKAAHLGPLLWGIRCLASMAHAHMSSEEQAERFRGVESMAAIAAGAVIVQFVPAEAITGAQLPHGEADPTRSGRKTTDSLDGVEQLLRCPSVAKALRASPQATAALAEVISTALAYPPSPQAVALQLAVPFHECVMHDGNTCRMLLEGAVAVRCAGSAAFYTAAVDAVAAWVAYVAYERRNGDFERARLIHKRAVASLATPQKFLQLLEQCT